ncbi:MAG: hypothetical protein K2J82_09460 [Muribaculaceae bacterium]|nr:hypothetical protein [Muribaculaceae bacterium]
MTPPFKTFNYLQARLGLKLDEIVDAVNESESPRFRLVSTGTTIPKAKMATDERRILLATNIACVMKKIVEGAELDPPAILKKKDIGYRGY